jgi:hypothetical protein
MQLLDYPQRGNCILKHLIERNMEENTSLKEIWKRAEGEEKM